MVAARGSKATASSHDDLVRVSARHPQDNQHLHHELVARRRTQAGRRAQPRGQLPLAIGGDPEGLLRDLLAAAIGPGKTVALQPLQRRADLAHVQRPDLAGAVLELLAESQPVLGSLAQQRAYPHEPSILDIMPSSILSIVAWRQRMLQ